MSKTYLLVATAMLAALAFVLQISNNVLGVPTGFGMTVDLVAVPAVLALFMLGFVPALEVLALSTLFIAIFAPTGPIGAAMKFAATAPTLLVCAAYLLMHKKGGKASSLFLVAALSALSSIALFLIGAFAYSYLGQANEALFGLLPIIAMAAAAYWLYTAIGKEGTAGAQRMFADKKSLAILAVLAVLVRGAAMVVANFYFAGPLYFKISPEQFVSMVNSTDILFFGKGSAWYLAIFAFNALQAAIEIGAAWLIAFKFGFAKKYARA
jgi:riboflavin transporter FmnP